ncbi:MULTISPECIES: hypothetical protein [Sphingobacterium]|uniref:Uncharacterized protein n=1 Tax=Sphingobacterium hotanense TaxID=649196 RepID=A0ABT7NP81_9SPHI|nr:MULTISPECIES: hypothetical protein [Sphingobacterium]MDM1048980.1 hypothetical protein [Sphingobacterium hotanense]
MGHRKQLLPGQHPARGHPHPPLSCHSMMGMEQAEVGHSPTCLPQAIAMGVSGILRGYPNTLAQPQRKVSVYLAVYRAPCKRRESISR